ncbi:MAG: hypothetical protein PsegKO_33890 [Pseudohongiellaceae bacterium]
METAGILHSVTKGDNLAFGAFPEVRIITAPINFVPGVSRSSAQWYLRLGELSRFAIRRH